MKKYSVEEKGEKGYLIKHTPIGDVVDLTWPLPSEGGGGGMQPGPNTVGTDEIIDDSVEMEDLSRDVKDKMLTGDNRVTQEELDQFKV